MFKKILYTLLLVIPSLSIQAQEDPIIPRPSPARLVNDMSGLLSSTEQQNLETKLTAFANETSNQIVIVIVDDLGGLEPWEYATKLGDKWKVGQEKFDNGVVLLIKPTGGEGQRKAHIAVGRGLEGAIPDATANQIKEKELIPNLAAKNYFLALDQSTNVLMSLASGEYNSDQYGARHKKEGMSKWKIGLILLIFIVVMIMRMRRGGGGGMTMGAAGVLFGSGLGRGFGGGGGGGGFGGFGGGSFGGGGAGGSW